MFTKKSFAAVVAALFAVVSFTTASATDYAPTPTTFTTEALGGSSFDVKFANIESAGLTLCFADGVTEVSFTLTDATGNKVGGTEVLTEIKDKYTVTFNISGAASATSGTYKINVPANSFGLVETPIFVGNDAFEITINYDNGQGGGEGGQGGEGGEGGEGGGDDVIDDPSVLGNVATFYLDNHKEEASVYYSTHDVIQSNAKGVELKFVRAGMENDSYSWSYKTWYGYTQFKDCEFMITAPNTANILKVEFVGTGSTSPTYSVDNLEAAGYEEGVWKGQAHSVTFNTVVYQQPVYDWSDDEDDDEPIIKGYVDEITGTRLTKIYVYLDVDVKKDTTGVSSTTHTPVAAGVKYDLQGRQYKGAGKLHKGAVIVR